MKPQIKKLIILFAIIFLLLIFFGKSSFKSYSDIPKALDQEEVNIDNENYESNKNFRILEVASDKKKQMEESLGYEIAEIKHIRLIDEDDYAKKEVANKEAYTIENISEVKNAIEFSGRDVWELNYKNKEYKKAGIKIGNKILKNDYMVDLPMDPKLISNALVFDVEKKNKIDLNLEIKVEGKTFATVSLFPEINYYEFEIHKEKEEKSVGSAKKVVGAYLIVRKEQINEI
ncbi:hypothetical protein [Peptoniphilus phoceensis]|uniref:hypothetical protein n=1 Tax=Peptoniphilus phoceensis TaxID=1720298 RepID=UPI000782AEDB|nr:hypothetical protein [Peptoniphilus phoceensis]